MLIPHTLSFLRVIKPETHRLFTGFSKKRCKQMASSLKSLFENVYWFNGILFIAIGIIELIYRGYNDLNLGRTYDWSNRIWVLFCSLLISFGYILIGGPCSNNIKQSTFAFDLIFWIIMVPLQSRHNLNNIIQTAYIITLTFCVIGVANDLFKLL